MKFKTFTLLAAGLVTAMSAFASPIPVTLDFEGATSFSSVANFYGGGTDSAGASGGNYLISFGGDALAISNDALGPYYSNAPTPGTVLAPVGADAALNRAAGFTDFASFYYSSLENTSVSVFSGLNGTGTLLGTFALAANAQNGCSDSPFCRWDVASINFFGIAQSIQFGSAANVAGFDNVKINAVPLPATLFLLLPGLGGMLTFVRRRKS